MSTPVYYDFNAEMEQVALFLRADSDLLADKLNLKIRQMMAAGMGEAQVVAALRRDLSAGGPIFSGFKSTFKSTVMPQVDNIAQGAVVAKNPKARDWEWVTTSADPCDDCKARHGQVKPYEEWRRLGLPRSGFSVCGDYCKCTLVPAIQVGRSLEDGPVEVDPLAAARKDFQERLRNDPALQARMETYRAQTRVRKSS